MEANMKALGATRTWLNMQNKMKTLGATWHHGSTVCWDMDMA
jgi:hypothetical protein